MLGVAITLMVATGPGQTVGVSVFVDHFIADLDLSRSQVSIAYLIGTLAGALVLPLVGRFVDRYGVHTMAMAVIAGFVAVLCGMSAVTGFLALIVGFAGIRGLGQGSLSLISSTTVAVWFDRRRGTAMGLLSALGGAGLSLVPLLATAFIGAWGWRTSWIALGAIVAALAMPLAVFVLRDPRFGPDAGVPVDPPLGDQPVVAAPVWTTAEILRHPAFWAMLLASASAAMLATALLFHQIDLLGARGLTEAQAAAVFVPQTLAGIVGALTFGRLSDRIAPRHLLVVGLILLASPTVLWHAVSPGPLAVAYGVAIGLGASSIRTIEGASLPKWYGTTSIGEIRGIIGTTAVAASAVGPVVLSVGRDLTGSYGATLTALGAVPLALAVFAASIHPPRRSPPG
jgi:MFS family permease